MKQIVFFWHRFYENEKELLVQPDFSDWTFLTAIFLEVNAV